jgi:hypothetical protein
MWAHLADHICDRLNYVEQRQRIQTLIGQRNKPHLRDAQHPARTLCRRLLRDAFGIYNATVSGSHTVGQNEDRHVITATDVTRNGSSGAKNLVIRVCADDQNPPTLVSHVRPQF